MARGKNYVNQNKGMMLTGNNTKATTSLNVAKQKKSSVVETCFYGAGCTRKDCIYRHPTRTKESSNLKQSILPTTSTSTTTTSTSTEKSQAPCKPYLAGMCSFNSITCNKRHVTDPEERERLIQQYSTTLCRHGTECKQINTGGCLYSHNVTTIQENNTNMLKVVPSKGMLPPLPINGLYQQQLPLPNNRFCSMVSSTSSDSNSQYGNPYINNNINNSSPAVPGSSLRVALPTGMIQQQQKLSSSSSSSNTTSTNHLHQSSLTSSTIPSTTVPMTMPQHEYTPIGALRSYPDVGRMQQQQQSFASMPSFQSANTIQQQQQQRQQQQQLHQQHSFPQQYQAQHHFLKIPQSHTGNTLQQQQQQPLLFRSDKNTASCPVVVDTNNDVDFPPLGSLSISTTSTKPKPKVQKQQQSNTNNQSSSNSTSKFNLNAQEFRPGGW
jgi:hypothetical protein